MTDFQRIVQLRNRGKTQEEIARELGISRRSVIRYLKDGKVPVYNRQTNSNRKDPMAGFYDLAKQKLESDPSILLTDLHSYLDSKGYLGSERTLRRKTRPLRDIKKHKEVYFQREVRAGEIMEGDFTELYVQIENKKRKVYLWVTTLPFSNTYFATAYYHCTFECFAEGSVLAFNEFNGIAQKYRLDNMSPAVSKILCGKDRVVTTRYKQLQDHYGFEQDFCNPAKGNEKGNVESNIRHIKRKILSRISLHNLVFRNLDAFKEFVWALCREHNELTNVQSKFKEEPLKSLPDQPFLSFRTDVVNINKYSLFTLNKTGHMYSVPSQYIGMSLELRLYPSNLELLHEGKIVASHKRIYGPRGLVSIELEHIINGLIKKPGAMKDWKHRHILFSRPSWLAFYNHLIANGGHDKNYLSCLRLILKHGRDVVTLAMELELENNGPITAKSLEKIITNEMDNIHEIKPLKPTLHHFDELLHGGNHGNQLKSES
ncbi:MAG: IS21 family transposase [Pseudomonadales bacterium]|nr:IS21 family transposase [Pseudomonadales bacterium]MBL4869285.1 IS21 family transposase [Pseudomonadales bacterium]